MKHRDPASARKAEGALRQRTIRAKKGKGSYNRKPKHAKD